MDIAHTVNYSGYLVSAYQTQKTTSSVHTVEVTTKETSVEEKLAEFKKGSMAGNRFYAMGF